MKRIAGLLIALVLLFAATGCGDHLDGPVDAKGVDSGYTYVYMMPMYTTTCSGNPSICTQTLTGFIPIVYYVPPCYWIHVTGETKDATGKTCLDQSRWNTTKIGDTYVGKDVKAKDRQRQKSG